MDWTVLVWAVQTPVVRSAVTESLYLAHSCAHQQRCPHTGHTRSSLCTLALAHRLHSSEHTNVVTSPPAAVQSIVISMSVCLSDCLSVRSHISKTSKFRQTFCTCYHWSGSVLFWWPQNTLHTSSFTVYVIFSRSGVNRQQSNCSLDFSVTVNKINNKIYQLQIHNFNY